MSKLLGLNGWSGAFVVQSPAIAPDIGRLILIVIPPLTRISCPVRF